MHVQLLLCDSAQPDANSSKVHMLGAGWDITYVLPGQSLSSHNVVAFFHVPWNDANRPQEVEFTLENEDGQAVQVAGATGDPVPLRVDGKIEVGRPPGIKAGSTLTASLTFQVAPGLPLLPGQSYAWVCRVKGSEVARARFQTASPRGTA